MGTGQMMLTIGAMILLSAIILRMNSVNLTTDEVIFDSKYQVTAIALANSIIEEAKTKAFDEVSANGAQITSPASLTAPSDLGYLKDGGELTRSDFDDFDDYNGYSYSTDGDTTIISADFDVSCVVNYVTTANPNTPTGSRTWHKRLVVSVSSPYILDESGNPIVLTFSYISSFWQTTN